MKTALRVETVLAESAPGWCAAARTKPLRKSPSSSKIWNLMTGYLGSKLMSEQRQYAGEQEGGLGAEEILLVAEVDGHALREQAAHQEEDDQVQVELELDARVLEDCIDEVQEERLLLEAVHGGRLLISIRSSRGCNGTGRAARPAASSASAGSRACTATS